MNKKQSLLEICWRDLKQFQNRCLLPWTARHKRLNDISLILNLYTENILSIKFNNMGILIVWFKDSRWTNDIELIIESICRKLKIKNTPEELWLAGYWFSYVVRGEPR